VVVKRETLKLQRGANEKVFLRLRGSQKPDEEKWTIIIVFFLKGKLRTTPLGGGG
jgi:hypothetical protein